MNVQEIIKNEIWDATWNALQIKKLGIDNTAYDKILTVVYLAINNVTWDMAWSATIGAIYDAVSEGR